MAISAADFFMFTQITSLENFKKAYLELSRQLLLGGKINHYSGSDALNISDLNQKSLSWCEDVRKELIFLEALSPAILVKIPKHNKPQQERKIFVYNLGDRLKAQAIYQVVVSTFSKYFSPYLFSYLPGRSSYFAARSVVRRYKKGENWVLTFDLSNYSEQVNHKILINQLKTVISEQETLELLKLFITNSFYDAGSKKRFTSGLVQGVPLIALFCNLYLDGIDKKFGPKVAFYRRVGDDLIFMDKNQQKIELIKTEVEGEIKNLGLIINQEKSAIHSPADSFNFLGYFFHDGLVSLADNFINRKIAQWQSLLSDHDATLSAKRKKVARLLGNHGAISKQWDEIILEKNLVDDDKQIYNISEKFFELLALYFYQDKTPRSQRLSRLFFSELKTKTFYRRYLDLHFSYAKK